MIITTTNCVEGREIDKYLGLVFGEIVSSLGFLGSLGAGLMSYAQGRVSGYEDEIIFARNDAIEEMKLRAEKMGANAVVGCKMDYEVLGSGGAVMMVSISGTAVKLK